MYLINSKSDIKLDYNTVPKSLCSSLQLPPQNAPEVQKEILVVKFLILSERQQSLSFEAARGEFTQRCVTSGLRKVQFPVSFRCHDRVTQNPGVNFRGARNILAEIVCNTPPSSDGGAERGSASWSGISSLYKYSCSSAISTLAGKENKRRLQTLSIDNAWSNKNFLVYLTFRMLQHTSSEVNGYNCYKHLKIQKIKRGTGDKIKITMTKLILPIVDTTGRN